MNQDHWAEPDSPSTTDLRSAPLVHFPGSQSWTVGELTDYIKESLDSDPVLQDIWLSGEISNPRKYPSGHLYFTLKDSDATLNCVMWRSAASRLRWEPEQGSAALAHGYISVYAARGSYQFYVDQLRPAGLGDLHARFEELRDRLREEGLFDPERKQAIPQFPRGLGIATSPQAAALRDVLNVLRRRYPLVRAWLAPTLVQGEAAPPHIVSALQALDARDDLDLILLVRGGGSLEELWAFNDERVARAIAACRHPVITGVGHETDFTIADFVADLRAPTPTAAAELAVPDRGELGQRIGDWSSQLDGIMSRRLQAAHQNLEQQRLALRRLSPRARVDTHRQQVDDWTRRAQQSLQHDLALRRSELAGLQARLVALSPESTLERGYAVVRRADTGAVVKTVEQVSDGDALRVRVRDGEFGAVTRSGS